jgi:predicted dehydrogenase
MSKVWKIGIYGAGMISEVHARALAEMKNAELVGVYARSEEKSFAFAEKYACKAFSGDPQSFFEEIDVVTIATPSGFHLEPTEMAAKNGVHVICEKPIEITLDRIDQMIRVCQQNKVTLCGIFPRRFHPVVDICKKAIDSGRLGVISSCSAYIKWYRSQEYYDSGAWRGTWKLDGGGALMNQSIHTIDLLQHLVGEVDFVHAITGTLAHNNLEVEDQASAVLKFKNGALGVIEGSTANFPGHTAEIQISGSKGSIFLEDHQLKVWEFEDALPEDESIRAEYGAGQAGAAGAADPKAIPDDWHRMNFEDALEAIEHQKVPAVDGQAARKAVEIIAGIYQSASEEGKRIKIQ